MDKVLLISSLNKGNLPREFWEVTEGPFILNKHNWSEQKNRWHEEKRLQFRPENLKESSHLKFNKKGFFPEMLLEWKKKVYQHKEEGGQS